MKLPKRDGFTLIELLMVIVIIGLLAAIAIPKFARSRDRAHESAIQTDLRNLVNAQEMYFGDRFEYATDVADLGQFQASSGVILSITYTANTGWAATGTHLSIPDKECGVRFGTAPLAAAPAATDIGSVFCTTN